MLQFIKLLTKITLFLETNTLSFSLVFDLLHSKIRSFQIGQSKNDFIFMKLLILKGNLHGKSVGAALGMSWWKVAITNFRFKILLIRVYFIQDLNSVSGIEISDVLKIDDKDYSITFSLYFNVQWSEPRLNLSQEFFNSENITGDEQLVPGL